jgi:hypothetical protein
VFIGAVIAVGVMAEYCVSRGWTLGIGSTNVPFRRSALLTLGGALALLLAGTPRVQHALGPTWGKVVRSLQRERLNTRDAAVEDRAYYEAIMTADQALSPLQIWRAPPGEDQVPIRSSGAVRPAAHGLIYELIPSMTSHNRGVSFKVDSLGLRDDEYARVAPPGTYRVVMLGGSVIMGSGVEHEEGFEDIVEDSLNKAKPSARFSNYEILNLAVGGYGLTQYVASAIYKGIELHPNMMILASLADETTITLDLVSGLVLTKSPLPPGLDSVVKAAGITPKSRNIEIHRKLRARGVSRAIRRWAYGAIADACRKNGIIPVWAFLPSVKTEQTGAEFPIMAKDARDAGMVVLDLRPAYDGVNRDTLQFTREDGHPNVSGHKLLAKTLYAALMAHAAEVGLTPDSAHTR